MLTSIRISAKQKTTLWLKPSIHSIKISFNEGKTIFGFKKPEFDISLNEQNAAIHICQIMHKFSDTLLLSCSHNISNNNLILKSDCFHMVIDKRDLIEAVACWDFYKPIFENPIIDSLLRGKNTNLDDYKSSDSSLNFEIVPLNCLLYQNKFCLIDLSEDSLYLDTLVTKKWYSAGGAGGTSIYTCSGKLVLKLGEFVE
jgi:hypothetical protein